MKRSLLPGTLLGAALALPAQTWTEADEAGNLPATAQIPLGSGALAQIDGDIDDPSEPLGASNDCDMYLIRIDDPLVFRATTVQGTTLDTQLFLFDVAGLGVTFNDDDPLGVGSLTSRISGQFVAGPGLYYLAVARYDRDATGSGDEIWADTPFVAERPPDGPGAAHPVDGWNGRAPTSVTGAYSIFLTGVSFPRLGCADLAISGSGAPGGTLTFALTGALPRALAMLVVGETQGAYTVNLGPLGVLELGLMPPFVPVPLGFTDGNGDASRRIRIPPRLPQSVDLFAQGFAAELEVQHGPPATVKIAFCTSDVEAFHVGT